MHLTAEGTELIMPFITNRTIERPYRMRSVPGGYPGDWVEHRTFTAGGKSFESSRISWGDGTVTVKVYEAGTTNVVRHWGS